MNRIEAKKERLRTLRRQVSWHRRLVVAVLVIEVLALTGLVLSRGASDVPGSPPAVES
ncbi:MAG: hypothetical protein OEN56_01060 [Gemmatimonadota bacterium]|nr:hypothetical protein [Gemmatimonadota bacterium]